MSEPAEADGDTVRAILTAHAHCEMGEMDIDKQMGIAGGDQVDLAFEALDRLVADALRAPTPAPSTNEGSGSAE